MATAWTAIFEYGGKNRKISVPATVGLDDLLRLVATRWKIAVPIELVYVDSATGDEMVLDVDDDLPSLLSQNFKWKVLASESTFSYAATAAAAAPAMNAPGVETPHKEPSGTDGAAATAVEDDQHDEKLACKKDKWIELISDDWQCKTAVQKHPFFISYRQASETVVAKDLFHEIQAALLKDFKASFLPEESKMLGLHAFWDAKCLAYGQKWGVNFMSGLFHSSVIILLCSDASMERMREADKKPDNCLLEWELALQMKKEKGHDILPILLSGTVTATLDNGKKALLVKNFSTFDHTKFPDRRHAHPLSPGLQTVSETVKMILGLNGPKAHPESDVLKIVTEARELYSRRKTDMKTPRPSPDISLSRSSLSELERWLMPLSELMDLERQALLKNVLSGSRQWLLKKVFLLLSPDDPSAASVNRVMWLKGVAGVGKSVMAAMISRQLQAQGMLGGLFFCKHDDERRSSARNLVLTLVFGLAKFSLQFGEILLQVKQDNPDILSRSVFEMMKVLLVQPLEKVVEAKKLAVPVVLVVDALDECGAINKRNEILSVFQELNRLLPENVKLLVTGRPEEDIAKAFERIPVEQIEPTAQENMQDQIEFTRDFLRSLNAEPHVVDEGSKLLVSKSAGIFVWLVTACTFLKKSQNEDISLEQIEDLPEGDKMDGSIDRMYDRIFSGIVQSATKSHLEVALKAVLSIIVFAYEPLTAAAIVSLLDTKDPESVRRCIRMLDPIIVLDGSAKKIRIFHKSVKDYLSNPSRCTLSVHIDIHSCHSKLASWCTQAMKKNLKFNMSDLPFSEFHSEIPDFDDRVAKGIPEHLRYAVKHFWEHCSNSTSKTPVSTSAKPQLDQSLFAQLQDIITHHGHHYLEASSLLDALDLVIPAMSTLQGICPADSSEQQAVHTIMEEMKRVLKRFLIPLKASALQVYFTAVPFSPIDSEFFKTFVGKVPANISCPRVMEGQTKGWPSCLNILEGHSSWVQSAALSPDGQLIVSGSSDNTIKIWNASTGQELQTLEGHSEGVNSVSFSSDGQFLVSGSNDKTIRIWKASTGQELHKLEGHTGVVTCASFSPNGQLIVSGSNSDNTIRIWNASTGQELRKLDGHSDYIRSARFSPDGQLIVSGSNDTTVRIWNASTGQELHKLEGHTVSVNSAAFSPDGKFVVSGSSDESVRIWDASTGTEIHNLEGHSDRVNSVAFSPSGQFVVSGSVDKTVRIWNADSGQEVCKLEGHSDAVRSTAFSPDGQFVVSASWDETVRIWDPVRGQEMHKLEGHSYSVNSAAISCDGQFVVSGSWDNTVRIWDAASGKELHKLEGHFENVNSAAFSPDGCFVVSASDDMTVRIWNASTGKELHKLEGHSYHVTSATFSPDGQFVVSGSWDTTARIWDASTGQELQKLEGHTDAVRCAFFGPDGRFIVSGSSDATVRIWSASSGQELHKLEGHSDIVRSAVFSPDGQFVVSGSDDDSVRIWNASSGQELHMLEGFSFRMAFAFTADGQSVVLEDRTGKKILVVLQTAMEVKEPDGPDGTGGSSVVGLRHNFWVRNLSGQKLQDGQTVPTSTLDDGVWFTFNGTNVCCWLPPEFRGQFQLLSRQAVFLLGEHLSSLVQF